MAECRGIEEGVSLTGIPERLNEKINTIPEKPDVYRMKDRTGHVMYIGKSQSPYTTGSSKTTGAMST